jgi:hypothetical protein
MNTHLLSFIFSDLTINGDIIRTLSPVRVYVPWGAHFPDYADDTKIVVSYPPEELRPAVDINLLLGECYNWVYARGDKNRSEIVKTSSCSVPDESIHSIMAILSGKPSLPISLKDMTIRWHLLLHLRDRFEKQKKEANRMIEAIRKKRSPLLNHADLTDNVTYPFETLKGMDEEESFITGKNIRQLLKSWHGLFNRYIEDGDLLLIIDRPVFDYLLNECEHLFSKNALKPPLAFSFKTPIFPEKDRYSDMGDDIHTIFSKIRTKKQLPGLIKLLARFESGYCTEVNDRHILFTALYMDIDMIKSDPFLKLFSGRIIVLAEINEPTGK